MGCLYSVNKKREEEFSFLKNKIFSIENDKTLKLRIDALTVQNNYLKNKASLLDKEKSEQDSKLLLLKEQMAAHGKTLDDLFKRVDIYHDILFKQYKKDKENEPVYNMLEIDHHGAIYKQYARCYKFSVGEYVSISFSTPPIYQGLNGPHCKCRIHPSNVLPDGLTFDKKTATLSGTVATKKEPTVYCIANTNLEHLLSIEVV